MEKTIKTFKNGDSEVPKTKFPRVVAINSSPRKDKGNTALILNPFIGGMKEKGAEVEVYYTKELRIDPCRGDVSCMKTTGKCFLKDDMEWLIPKIAGADILILASPLYCDGVTGPMKLLMDRLPSNSYLTMEIRDDRLRHPLRQGWNVKKLVLVSNCGFWEMENFDPLKSHIQAFSENMNAEYAGEVLRPHGPIFRAMLENNMQVDDVIESAKKAGHELIEEGKISSETMNNISRPLMPREEFLQMINQKMR